MAGDYELVVTTDGIERWAQIHVPPGFKFGTPAPVVLAFHGITMDAMSMDELTGLAAYADDNGLFVVYPAGVGDPTTWNATESADAPDDVAFTTALIESLGANFCIDKRRVYAAGFSVGGAMAQLAACRIEGIAAIALIAAVHGPAGTDCTPGRPVPTVYFHGVLDPIIPWRGGPFPLPDFDLPDAIPVEDWAATWANSNRCTDPPVEAATLGWVVKFSWMGCLAPLLFYRVGDGGHTWPGGGGTTAFGAINQDISASAISWQFFVENPAPVADER
jgi:polyhydroxybutyrate depolymerase